MNAVSRKSATFVLKTVERCNINCTYCYFFNGMDHSYKQHSPYITQKVVEQIASFLADGCNKLALDLLYIGIHGGEPLMQNRQDFDIMCKTFLSKIPNKIKIIFSIQTNGMLIDNQWLDLLAKYKFNIGLSIDGPKEYHDRYRITKRNKGTFNSVREKLQLIKDHPYYKKVGIGVLTVINPEFDAKKIYRYFVDKLELDHIDFLIPDYTYNYKPPFEKEALSKYIIDLFDEWNTDDNPKIRIRLFESIIRLLLGKSTYIYGFGSSSGTIPLITISSDGDLSPVDELRTAIPKKMYSGKNVFNTTLYEFIQHPIFDEIDEALNTIPKGCSDCCWQKACGGGPILNKYSHDNGFNNISIYCEDLKKIYAKMTAYLIKNGISFLEVEKALLNS